MLSCTLRSHLCPYTTQHSTYLPASACRWVCSCLCWFIHILRRLLLVCTLPEPTIVVSHECNFFLPRTISARLFGLPINTPYTCGVMKIYISFANLWQETQVLLNICIYGGCKVCHHPVDAASAWHAAMDIVNVNINNRQYSLHIYRKSERVCEREEKHTYFLGDVRASISINRSIVMTIVAAYGWGSPSSSVNHWLVDNPIDTSDCCQCFLLPGFKC